MNTQQIAEMVKCRIASKIEEVKGDIEKQLHKEKRNVKSNI